MKAACIIEESTVDPKRKIMTTYSRNIFFTSLMVVEEKCVYSVCPSNKNWTECRKDAWISSNVFGLARTIEAFGIERYKRNIDKVNGFCLHKITHTKSLMKAAFHNVYDISSQFLGT